MTEQVDNRGLIEALRKPREGFDTEGSFLRFLIDAYTGGGGFQGRITQPVYGWWGQAAEAYSQYATVTAMLEGSYTKREQQTYLDRFPREDAEKFQRRLGVAHYLNYIKPTTNLKISYLVRKMHTRTGVPDRLQKWIEATNYDAEFRRRALTAAVLGWFPMLVDMPAVNPNALTAAQAGSTEPFVRELLPCHLLDYALDDAGKSFLWAKTCVKYDRRAAWDAPCEKVERITVWTPKDFAVWEIATAQDGSESISGGEVKPHDFGAVPIVPWRADTNVEEPVKADSKNADASIEARRLFNLLSEFDEHLRSQVFAVLVYPRRAPANGAATVGVDNGLEIDPEQKNVPFYLQPGTDVSEVYEARITATIIEIYRMQRVEYDRASGTESSAQSKQQNFEQTNLDVADLAAAIAKADHATLTLVGRALGCSKEQLAAMQCTPATNFATEELAQELEQTTMVLAIRTLGQTFRAEYLKRLAAKLLPYVDAKTRKVIESEIEEAVAREEQEAQALADAAAEPPDDGGDSADEDEPDQDEEQQAAE